MHGDGFPLYWDANYDIYIDFSKLLEKKKKKSKSNPNTLTINLILSTKEGL